MPIVGCDLVSAESCVKSKFVEKRHQTIRLFYPRFERYCKYNNAIYRKSDIMVPPPRT